MIKSHRPDLPTKMHKQEANCQYSIRLIEKLKSVDLEQKLDFTMINKAICWAREYHGSQMRKSGEPFYSHPLEVAYMISDHIVKTDVIVASILHDIIEDTEVTAGMILDNFSWRIAEMVHMLTRDRTNLPKIEVSEIMDNCFLAKDKEVMLIKIYDRLHNLLTLSWIKPEKQIQLALETMHYIMGGAAFLGDIELEQKIAILAKQILVDHKMLNSIENIYDITLCSDNCPLEFPKIQNEEQHIKTLPLPAK